MSEKDGGPVHPVPYGMHAACVREENCRVSEGLSLRDYFAAKALPMAWEHIESRLNPYSRNPFEDVAETAFMMADAMLAAREAK